MAEKDLPNGVQVEEIEIPVPWGHVAGRWWGPRDKQPVIAVHGWQDNAGTWDNLIPLLSPTLPVLCIDLPGHGLSSHYNRGKVYYVAWDGVVILRLIVKHFHLQKVVFLGHSLGAGVCVMYAGIFPEEVDRIICVDAISAANFEPHEYVKVAGYSIDKMLEYEKTSCKDFLYSYDDLVNVIFEGLHGSVSKENCKVLMKRGSTKTDKGYHLNRDLRLITPALGLVSLEQAIELAVHVKCKILYIKSKRGEVRSKQEYHLKVLEKLKEVTNVTYNEVEGTHHVHLNTPERIVPLIEQYFKDLF